MVKPGDFYQKAAQLWLSQAEDNLKWAKNSFKGGFFTQTCFVSQQIAETVLKGYLRNKGKKIVGTLKTHDLLLLLKECAKYEKDFQNWREACEKLTEYYAPTRYPEVLALPEYTQKTAEEALNLAEKILEFVRGKIKK